MLSSWLSDLHCFGVPVDDGAAVGAQIAEQGSAGCAESKGCVFDNGLATAHRVEEVVKVVVAVGIAFGRREFLNRLGTAPA